MNTRLPDLFVVGGASINQDLVTFESRCDSYRVVLFRPLSIKSDLTPSKQSHWSRYVKLLRAKPL